MADELELGKGDLGEIWRQDAPRRVEWLLERALTEHPDGLGDDGLFRYCAEHKLLGLHLDTESQWKAEYQRLFPVKQLRGELEPGYPAWGSKPGEREGDTVRFRTLSGIEGVEIRADMSRSVWLDGDLHAPEFYYRTGPIKVRG